MIFLELFYVFFLIGLFTFGGGYAMIPMIEEQVVTRGWISESTLVNFIALSESTPGPFAINIATFVGSQTGGIFGAICATLGVVLPSFIIILILAAIFTKILNNRFVKGALNGVKPVVIALILGTAITFLIKLFFSIDGASNAYSLKENFRGSFVLLFMLFAIYIGYKKVKKKSLNPVFLLLISAVLGVVIYWIM